MYQVVAISHDPTVLSLLKNYCQSSDLRWQLRVFPTPGSFLSAPSNHENIDLLVFDAQSSASALEERRLACFMAPLALRVVVTTPEHEDVVIKHLSMFHSFVSRDLNYEHLTQLFVNAERLVELPLREYERLQLGKLTDYPVFPSICNELRQLLASPNVGVPEVARLVARDPLVVSRLLQLVNSPYMGFASETYSLETAISRLGFQLLQTLVLMLTIKAQQEQQQPEMVSVLEQQLVFAGECRKLAQQVRLSRVMQDQVYIAAILTGFGKLILLRNGCSPDDVEMQLTPQSSNATTPRLSYVAVAAFLLTLWGFDDALVSTVLNQQQWHDGNLYQVSQCLWVARMQQDNALLAQDAEMHEKLRKSGYASLLPQVHSSA